MSLQVDEILKLWVVIIHLCAPLQVQKPYVKVGLDLSCGLEVSAHANIHWQHRFECDLDFSCFPVLSSLYCPQYVSITLFLCAF